LCSQVFRRDLLYQHILAEHPRLRHRTIKVIQAYHPGWLEDHGACGPCWKSYREVSRMFNLMKNVRPQSAAGSLAAVALAAERNRQGQTNPPGTY